MSVGLKAKVSPLLTGLTDWIEGVVIKIRTNPFTGEEIAVQDKSGRIFFGEARYFQPA